MSTSQYSLTNTYLVDYLFTSFRLDTCSSRSFSPLFFFVSSLIDIEIWFFEFLYNFYFTATYFVYFRRWFYCIIFLICLIHVHIENRTKMLNYIKVIDCPDISSLTSVFFFFVNIYETMFEIVKNCNHFNICLENKHSKFVYLRNRSFYTKKFLYGKIKYCDW